MVAINPNIFQSQISALLSICQHVVAQLELRKKKKTTQKTPSANPGGTRIVGLISGLGRSPGEENGNLLQYFCLENPMNRGAWWPLSMGLQRVRHD